MNYIAHAGGLSVNGDSYTNALSTLDYSYSIGFRKFEIDLSFTSDNKLVCTHDWDENYKKYFILEDYSAPNYMEFVKNIKLGNSLYDSCTKKTLFDWIDHHKDAKVIMDLKGEYDEQLEIWQKIITELGKYSDTNISSRLIPSLPHCNWKVSEDKTVFDAYKEINPNSTEIYCHFYGAYQKIYDYLKGLDSTDKNLMNIEIPLCNVKNIFIEDMEGNKILFIDAIKDLGYKVNVFSLFTCNPEVNDILNLLKEKRIDQIYSDHIYVENDKLENHAHFGNHCEFYEAKSSMNNPFVNCSSYWVNYSVAYHDLIECLNQEGIFNKVGCISNYVVESAYSLLNF